MNCEDFEKGLPDFLDGTWPPAENAAWQGHIRKCGACQQALTRQEAFAKSARGLFDSETQGLSLGAETRRKVLSGSKQKEIQPTSWEILSTVIAKLGRPPIRAGVVLVCILLLVFSGRFIGDKSPRNTYVVDVPMEREVHIFQRQNNAVIDDVVEEVTVIDGSFSETINATQLKPKFP